MTDRASLHVSSSDAMVQVLLQKIEKTANSDVDWIQIREKDLSARELMQLTGEAKRIVAGKSKVLINGRIDVALVSGADGVHLGETDIPVSEAKRFVKELRPGGEFLIGASTHSLLAARRAQESGADYIIYGPVFATPSKSGMGEPQGVENLREVCESVTIPVLAIGGVTPQNAHSCVQAGTAGIAAIRMFQDAADVAAIVKALCEQ